MYLLDAAVNCPFLESAEVVEVPVGLEQRPENSSHSFECGSSPFHNWTPQSHKLAPVRGGTELTLAAVAGAVANAINAIREILIMSAKCHSGLPLNPAFGVVQCAAGAAGGWRTGKGARWEASAQLGLLEAGALGRVLDGKLVHSWGCWGLAHWEGC